MQSFNPHDTNEDSDANPLFNSNINTYLRIN